MPRRILISTLAAALLVASPTLATPPGAPLATDPDPWFGRDKAYHFAACAGISGLGYGLTAFATNDLRIRVGLGAGLGIAVGATKELLDLSGMGDPSWKDFTWDVIGTVVGVGIAISIDLGVRGLHPKTAEAAP